MLGARIGFPKISGKSNIPHLFPAKALSKEANLSSLFVAFLFMFILLIKSTTMFTAATRIGSRYAAPAAATGTLLVLSLSPDAVEAKAEAAKTADVAAVKKYIADIIEDDAERRGDGTSLTGTFVRVNEIFYFIL